jgi:uncharacterized protein DUF1828
MIAPCKIIAETLGSLFHCEQVNEYVRIRTPFMYPDGDSVDLYLREHGASLTLTDLGEALQWLWTHQVSERRTKRQELLVQEIATRAGVEVFRDMLIVRLRDPQQMAQAVTALSQAVLRVADIWFTFRARTAEAMVDDVAEFLAEEKISYEQNRRYIGRSGKAWKIDFYTRSRDRSALVKVLSTGSRAAAKQVVDTTVAGWYDLSHLSTDPEGLRFVSLLDDTTDVWSGEDIRRVEDISEIAFWSRPDQFVEKLAA